MNIARGPGRQDWPGRDEWYGRHGWHDHRGGHGHALWHAGPALIGMMVLGFIFCWPLGIVALALTLGSAKMIFGHYGESHWGGRFQERMMARRARWEEKMAEHHERHSRRAGSGNRAFDEYRAETLRRLEDEEKEFREFLNQLRFAKDKAEFDDFLANRRPPAPPEPDAPSQG